LNLARAEGYHTWAEGKRQYLVDVMTSAGRQYYVAVVAEDLEGYSQLYNLRDSLVWGGLFGVALAGGIAWLFAGWSMAPVRELIRQALAIQNPSQRLEVLETEDELGGLSNAFNRLLMRLQESFEMQRSFISNASHELRTPLTVLQAELEQLQQLAEKQEEQALIESAKASTTHLATLVQQLLWLAQSSQAPENVPLEHLRLDEIAYEALQQARRQYPGRELVLDVSTLEADNTEPMVLGNPTLLRAACYNLLSNACKYATQGTAVLVSVRQQTGRVLFTVADKGPGLPAEELVKLKEPFYRSPAVSSQTGSGIGLALTDRIATLHKGQLTLQATLGAAFVAELSLPLASTN
jgi:two-component system, OmpR family, sensor histidine kinase ArlS